MDQVRTLDYDSDIIICDDIPVTILVPSSPETQTKNKAKKRKKRKIKRTINNNFETLLITQKLHVKKTAVNTLCKKSKSDSIVRFDQNVCKEDAYYHRIQPICTRKTCFDKNSFSKNCCRPTVGKKYKKAKTKDRSLSLSSMSSISLTDISECNNLSYEEISDGNFSSASEELETLIKRTKQRDKTCDYLYSRVNMGRGTCNSKFDDSPSLNSVDMEKSLHSDTTMILNPLSNEAYSPTTSLDYIDIGKIEKSATKTNDSQIIYGTDVPYSPTMSPILTKTGNVDYVYARSRDDFRDEDNLPYSPTYTPESMELGNIDNDYGYYLIKHENKTNCTNRTFTIDVIEKENSENAFMTNHIRNDNDVKKPDSSTIILDLVKTEK